MLLIDLNQITIANIFEHQKDADFDETYIRHMVLNSLRLIIRQFKFKYPEIIVCSDARKSWRHDFFPYYKAVRRNTQASSKTDWKLIHDTITRVRIELQENFLHKVLNVEGAEADDIIATLALSATSPVCIVSSDKDFLQLQWKPNIVQWSPRTKAFMTCDDPTGFLREHIIRGDQSDGIPNILSDDTSFVFKTRQKVMTLSRFENLQQKLIKGDLSDIEANYIRNKTLIDLESIPQEVKDKCLEAYRTARKGNKQELMNYFLKNNMGLMIEDLTDY